MKRISFILSVVLLSATLGFSQTSGGTSGSGSSGSSGSSGGTSSGSGSTSGTSTGGNSGSAAPRPSVNQQAAYQQMIQQRIQQQMVNDSFQRLRDLSEQANTVYIDRRVISDINAIYRKSSKKDLATIAVSEADRAKYAAFLTDKNSGLIKLIPNINCSEDNKVISANEECLKYSVPGAGAAYSFRAKDYRIQRLADLIYTGDTFKSEGVLSLPLMTTLGDTPLESVTLQTPALSYLVNFQPKITAPEAAVIYKKLSGGFSQDNQSIGRGFKAVENVTYALRSIAYNGIVPRAVSSLTYNELGFDKRRDVIVVFRIVRKEADGSATILWRELARKDSPEMKKSEKIREGFVILETEKDKKKKND